MTLAILNGSPRRQKSNSKILTEHFLSGYRSRKADENVLTGYLAETQKKEENLEKFNQADTVIIIFPLYTDCMPGIVKEFFEHIAALEIRKPKKIGFIVQSGFPEAIHSIYLEKYLEKLIRRLHCDSMGVVIKGGVEGIQVMPESMTRKLYRKFNQLGSYFAHTGQFDPQIIESLRSPFRMSAIRRLGFRVFSITGLQNFYWNSHLKKHGAFEKRFDRPYQI